MSIQIKTKHALRGGFGRLLTVSIVGAVLAVPAFAQTTTTFRQGVNSYGGHEDAPINQVNGGDRNWGGDSESTLGFNSNGTRFRQVERWDMGGLDTSNGVASATLEWTLKDKGVGGAQGTGKGFLFALKPANDDWTEGSGAGGVGGSDNGDATYNDKSGFINTPSNNVAWTGGQGAGPALTSGGNPPASNNGYYVDPIGEFSWDSGNLSGGDVISISLSGASGLGDGSLTTLIDSWTGLNNAGFVTITDAEGGASTQRIFPFTSEAAEANRPQLSVTTNAIPEPQTYALLGGLAALGAALLRRRRS